MLTSMSSEFIGRLSVFEILKTNGRSTFFPVTGSVSGSGSGTALVIVLPDVPYAQLQGVSLTVQSPAVTATFFVTGSPVELPVRMILKSFASFFERW